MIDDLIEFAYARDIVRETLPAADGCDHYVLACPGDTAIHVWVRPDGRFSRAVGEQGALTIGQVAAASRLSYAGRAERSAA
ncbi:hypothetical protein [Rhodococcus sp. SGAir0479]|uniref:hypothetical protein n=1 Tax=Rhodococcus sp. SGAir0479 TaxID=2567884 RepID=UPI0010CCCA3E|nr:hypothetical protein [Rhodococcus sp. SGAir0479]QCQ90007.1 hypothetical protein E7742_01485 [Rhodococcus sp. SGAir0479]